MLSLIEKSTDTFTTSTRDTCLGVIFRRFDTYVTSQICPLESYQLFYISKFKKKG